MVTSSLTCDRGLQLQLSPHLPDYYTTCLQLSVLKPQCNKTHQCIFKRYVSLAGNTLSTVDNQLLGVLPVAVLLVMTQCCSMYLCVPHAVHQVGFCITRLQMTGVYYAERKDDAFLIIHLPLRPRLLYSLEPSPALPDGEYERSNLYA